MNPYVPPRAPGKAIDPTLKAFQSLGSCRLHGTVTVVVPVRSLDEYFPTGDQMTKLRLWIEAVVLARMAPNAMFRLVYE